MLRHLLPASLLLGVLLLPMAAADNRVMVYCDQGGDCGTSAKNTGSCDPVFPGSSITPCFGTGDDGSFAVGVIAGSPADTCESNDDCYNVVANLCYDGRLLGVEMPNRVGQDIPVEGERPAFDAFELGMCLPNS